MLCLPFKRKQKILLDDRCICCLLLVLKDVGSARLRESDIHPIRPKTPAPQYQLIGRKKRKGKIVEDFVGIKQPRPIKKHWPCS